MVMWRSYPAPLPRDILVGRVDRARATSDALFGRTTVQKGDTKGWNATVGV